MPATTGEIAKARETPPAIALPPFTFAFQPIVDMSTGAIFSYEALVRGPANESASFVLGSIGADAMPYFDGQARLVAIDTSARPYRVHRNLLRIRPTRRGRPAEVLVRDERDGKD